MSNVFSLINRRQRHLFDAGYVHTLRSNQTLAIEISKETTIKVDTKYATTTIDVDNGGQYLLSGDSVGALSIHEINKITDNATNELSSLCSVSSSGQKKFSITSTKWYPNDTGMFITGSSDKSVKVWDTNEMIAVDTFTFAGHVYDVDLSRRSGKTSNLIAVGLSTNQIKLCDMNSGSQSHTLRGHTAPVNCITWSNRNSYALISAGRDGKIIMWDIRRSNSAVHYLDRSNGESQVAHSGSVTSLSQTEGGLFLLSSGQDRQVRCWDLNSGENTLTNFGANAATPDIKHVGACVSRNSCYPGLLYLPNGSDISVYDILSGNHLTDYSGHFGRVNGVCYNTVRPQLFSCSSDCTVLVWEPPGPPEEGDDKETAFKDSWSDSDSDNL